MFLLLTLNRRRPDVFIVNFERFAHLFLVSIVNFEQVNVHWDDSFGNTLVITIQVEPFQANFSFLYHTEILENLGFFVFRGHKKETLTGNGSSNSKSLLNAYLF